MPGGCGGGHARAPFGQLSTVTALASPGFAFLAAWRRAAELAGPLSFAGRRYGTGTTTRGECPALPAASATLA